MRATLIALLLLAACTGEAESDEPENRTASQETAAPDGAEPGETGRVPDARTPGAEQAKPDEEAPTPPHSDRGEDGGYRFVGRWATEAGNCSNLAWRFTASSLTTPAGSVCRFRQVREVPGGFDIAAHCTAEGTQAEDTLQLRFAESARALLFESEVIADAGLVRCG